MKKKICLISDHHISVNPRLWKEAFCYEKHGYEVVILVMWITDEWRKRDLEILEGHRVTYKSYLNLIPGEVPESKRTFFRVRKKLAGELVRTGLELPYAISYGPDLMLKAAIAEKADFYIAHLECAFYTGKKLLQKGHKVAFDFEDWYSRDYLNAARPVKFLKELERYALVNGTFCTTTSKAMADALKECYGVQRDISVVYNGFSVKENEGIEFSLRKKINGVPKIIWFSRTVGKGRGVEKTIEAISNLDAPVEFHLLGDTTDAYKGEIEKIFPYNRGHKLIFHSFIPHNKLLAFLSEFDIGMAVEELEVDNKQLTVSNKLFQYLQAGLFIVATKTKGQMEVASLFPGSVTGVEISRNQEWTDALSLFINGGEFDQQERMEKFNALFSWEAQEKKLLSLLNQNF